MRDTRWLIRTAAVLASVLAYICQADVAGFKHYRSRDLTANEKVLASKVDSSRVSFVRFDDFGNSRTYLVHRSGSADAELHDNIGDYFVVRSGRATLVVGGQLIEPRVTEPGESQARSISGGEKIFNWPRRHCSHPGKSASSIAD